MLKTPYGVYLRTYACPQFGYGRVAVQLARYLHDKGVRLRISHIGKDVSIHDIPHDLQPFVTENPSPWPWQVVLGPPDHSIPDDQRAVYITMWEATRLLGSWVNTFNRCDAVVVPSEFCHKIFDANGVTAPIYKAPLGVDTSIFRPIPGHKDRIIFGACGRTSLHGAAVRKSLNTIIDAFTYAFPEDYEEDVSLEIKLSSKCKAPHVEDPRVRYITEDWSEHKLARWYASLTAFVNVSHGEGFLLPGLEAMACETPVMTPLFSGETEYLNAANCVVLPHKVVPTSGIYQEFGIWCEVDFFALADQLRYVACRSLRLNAIAKEGYRTAIRFTWDECCSKIHGALTEAGVFDKPPESLPNGVPLPMALQPPPPPEDEFAKAFGIGKAQQRPMPPLPLRTSVIDSDGVLVMGPNPSGCGVGQYAVDVANAIGGQFGIYGDPVSNGTGAVLIHHHRHYWEKLPLNRTIYDLYAAGHDIVLDIHDPGGIEELRGYVSKVIYHTPSFEGYIEKALPDAERVLIPLMCPEFPEGGTPLLDNPDPEVFYIGWHGLFVEHKGLPLILGALRYIQDRGAPIGLIAFGNYADIDHSTRTSSEKCFNECIEARDVLKLKHCHIEAREFTPAEILATLKQCSIFVLPYTTNHIGQSSAVTAVMQPGKPIIVSDVPMFADVVQTCANPLRELNSDCIADTVQHLLMSDESSRAEWSQKVADEYERRKPAAIAELYREVLCRKAVTA